MKWLDEKLQHHLVIRKQRQQLLAMDERMRNDLAISRIDAERYAGRDKKQITMGEKTDGRNQLAAV